MTKTELLERYNKGARDFSDADLSGADLSGADLRGTCLDPMVPPNCGTSDFETIDGEQWCVGYRTQNSPHMEGDGYQVGELYEAPIFSTADTECHPGIFVLPTVKSAQKWGPEIVKVIFRPWECHRAGDKWRVRRLIVWSDE